MIIVKKSILTGVTHEMELPISGNQLAAWQQGELIQDAMPELTADQREFLMTGITPDEWAKAFPEEDE